MIAASQKEAADARRGAKAGAKQRRRESAENADSIAAVLDAEKTGRGSWSYSYRAGTLEDGTADRRTVTVRENARREVDAATLLKVAREAARLAAARLRSKHGIPEISPDERADMASELVARLLADCEPGRMPARENLTRAYLVQRAMGFILDDPERQSIDADAVLDADAIAANADARARAKTDAHDPMLNRGIDGTWPEVAAACERTQLPAKAARAAAYLTAGGTVRGDWSEVWNVSEGYAATRTVPEGTAALRALLAADANGTRPLAGALLLEAMADAARPDHRDRAARTLRAIESGMTDAPRPARAVPDRRWRTEPDTEAPVTVKTDRRIVVKSERTKERNARRAGWLAAAA